MDRLLDRLTMSMSVPNVNFSQNTCNTHAVRHMDIQPHLWSKKKTKKTMGQLTSTATFHIINYMFKFLSDRLKADYFSLLFGNVVYLLLWFLEKQIRSW